jgi:hypothetical protein
MLPPFSGLNVMRRTEMITSDLRKRIRIGAEIGLIIGDDQEFGRRVKRDGACMGTLEWNRVQLKENK